MSTIAPKKTHRLSYTIDSYTSGVNQQFVGPGTVPTYNANNFIANPPITPYDQFSGATNTTGEGLSFDLILKPTYLIGHTLQLSASLGYGSVGGSANAISYWGDAAMPTINAFTGSRAYTLTPAFPTHNGGDAVSAARGSVLSGAISTQDGKAALTAGWFDQKVSVPYVFDAAPWPNTPFALAPTIPGSIGDPPPSDDVITPQADRLPVQGASAYGKIGDGSFEFLDANLPAPYFAPARVDSLAVVISHSDTGVTYSGSIAHLSQSGPETGRMLFGSFPGLGTGAIDGIPVSTVFGQRMTVVGLGAVFPILESDAELRYAQSCYNADGAALNTTECTTGNYYYAKLHHGFHSFDFGAEVVRYEPTYAPAVLDYGSTVINTWQTPFAFPGTSLPGTYAFTSSPNFAPNRQGFRLSATTLISGVELRLAYAQYSQVQAYDGNTAYKTGFIEPYFLPQLTTTPTTSGTLGTDRHASAWLGWHPKFGDVSLEFSDVTAGRAGMPGHPEQAVSMDYPSAVFTLAHNFGPKIYGAAGVGRLAAYGSYDNTGPANADLSQDVIFVGGELRQNANSAYGLEYRLYSTNGSPVYPGAYPAYHGPQIQFYQRLKT